MYLELLQNKIVIPNGVTVQEKQGSFTVKGPKGEIKRRLFSSKLQYAVEDGTITVSAKDATKREKTILYTMSSHLRNMLEGAEKGFVYKLKICSGHFPMSVSVKGDIFEIKNFIGEAVPRRLKLYSGAKVEINGEIVTVEGADIEVVGQQAAAIERLSRRVGFDRRIFQDGIYITHKGDESI